MYNAHHQCAEPCIVLLIKHFVTSVVACQVVVNIDGDLLLRVLTSLAAVSNIYSGGSRPSPKGGAFEGLTMNVEFCEDNAGRSNKMRYFRKNKGGGLPWIRHCIAS